MSKSSWTLKMSAFSVGFCVIFLAVFYVSYFFDESLEARPMMTRQEITVEQTKVDLRVPCEGFTLPPETAPPTYCV